mgnify:CR=1 FL=1
MKISIEIQPPFDEKFIIDLFEDNSKYILSYSGKINIDEINLYAKKNNTIYLTAQEWKKLIEELNCKINIIPEFSMGLDGCTCIINIENGFNNIKYNLWEVLYDDNPFGKFIKYLLKLINNKITQTS